MTLTLSVVVGDYLSSSVATHNRRALLGLDVFAQLRARPPATVVPVMVPHWLPIAWLGSAGGHGWELAEWRWRKAHRPGTSWGTRRRYRGYSSGKVATIRRSSMRILTSNTIRPAGKSTIH